MFCLRFDFQKRFGRDPLEGGGRMSVRTFKTFGECWDAIQKYISSGMMLEIVGVPDHAPGTFYVLYVESGAITVEERVPFSLRGAHNPGTSRRITRNAFERVFAVWDDYKWRRPRHELGGFNEDSVYIIPIISWVERT